MSTDVCTIVSAAPFLFKEFKSGVYPSLYEIPPAERDDFHILIIQNCTTWEYIDEQRGSRAINIPAEEMAKALIEDAVKAMPQSGPEAYPAIFYIVGAFSKDDIKKRFADKIKTALKFQNNWFERLVHMADDDYAETHQLKHISSIQRSAATLLGLKREWNVDIASSEMKECPYCITLIPARAVICRNCQSRLTPEAPLPVTAEKK